MALFSTGSIGQSTEWLEKYEELKKDYEEAFVCVDKAIRLDEQCKTTEALAFYEFGLNLIDKALSIAIECPTNPDLNWEKANVMLQKMRKTRKEIISRIDTVRKKPHPDAVAPPPSYEEAMASAPGTSAAPATLTTAMSDVTLRKKDNQVPGTSVMNVPYIPPSAMYDADLANLIPPPESREEIADSPTYAELSGKLNEMKISSNHRDVIYSLDNVQIYFISTDGRVSAPMEPGTLIIGRLEDATSNILDDTLHSIVDQLKLEQSTKKHNRHRPHHLHRRRHRRRHRGKSINAEDIRGEPTGQVFLQLGSWVYPLIPGVSPCIRSEIGAYILPDVTSNVDGAAIGLIVPAEADETIFEILSTILNSEGEDDQKFEQRNRSKRSKGSTQPAVPYAVTLGAGTPSPFSSNLVKGASYIANNLVRSAKSTARFIDLTTPRIIDRMEPAPEAQPISPTFRKSLDMVKSASGKAANVTDYLASKLGLATSALGKYLAPHVQKQGTRLLTKTTKLSEEEAAQKMSSFLDITSGTVEGIATVYSGLESAAGILANSLSSNTVQVIQYKYGQPVASAAGDAFTTAGNVYSIHHNAKLFKPKGIAKATAKGAGNAILEDYRNSLSHDQAPHEEFRGSGPGDGSGFQPKPI